MTRICGLLLLFFVGIARSTMGITDGLEPERAKYRPYASGFEQVIQEFDYETIEFIESVYSKLKKLGPKVTCVAAKDKITFNSANSGLQPVTLKKIGQSAITLGNVTIKYKNSIQLVSTLIRMVYDLGMKKTCQGVAVTQYATRAYNRRTVLEISFGDCVVVIDAFSNGSEDDERLYVLDLFKPADSLLWSGGKTTDSR